MTNSLFWRRCWTHYCSYFDWYEPIPCPDRVCNAIQGQWISPVLVLSTGIFSFGNSAVDENRWIYGKSLNTFADIFSFKIWGRSLGRWRMSVRLCSSVNAFYSDLTWLLLMTAPNKLVYLEGIRGIASFVVVMIHFLPMIGKSNGVGTKMMQAMELYQPHYLNPMVHVFFLLSGRVLTASILKNQNVDRLTSSIIRRPFRLLFPCFGVMLFFNLWWFILYKTGFNSEWTYAGFRQVITIPFQFVVWDGKSDIWPIPVFVLN